MKNFNRNSFSGSSPPGSGLARPSSPATGGTGARTPRGSHVKRSSAGRVGAFERRTMASDAEEDIIQ